METIQDLLNASPAVVLVFVLNCTGVAIKKVPRIPDWTIPLLLPLIGAIAYPFVAELSPKIAAMKHPAMVLSLYGAGLGWAAVGLNQMLRQFLDRNDTSTVSIAGDTTTTTTTHKD